MIKIFLGNLGSGKTACAVRDIALSRRLTYSNIVTKIANCKKIDPTYIIQKEIVDYKKNKKSSDLTPVYKFTLNTEFWKNVPKPCNVVLDEAHSIINSRRSMSKTNVIVSEWLAMLRRVLNDSEGKTGDLILISQRLMKLDENARDLATMISYHICHWIKTCETCGQSYQENSQQPKQVQYCLRCGYDKLKKHSHAIEVFEFEDEEKFNEWQFNSTETFFDNYLISDIEKYFPMYNTLQWDNLFAGFY